MHLMSTAKHCDTLCKSAIKMPSLLLLLSTEPVNFLTNFLEERLDYLTLIFLPSFPMTITSSTSQSRAVVTSG